LTSSELAKEVFSILEAKILGRPSPVEFEMAYQVRVEIEKIRFAVKQIEQFSSNAAPLCEANLQLLDALDRLEGAEHNFQSRRRCSDTTERSRSVSTKVPSMKEPWTRNGRSREHS
jgi:hypothetical protein